MTTADDLFHTDADGERAMFVDVLADGLEGELDDRIPALRELLEASDVSDRLFAALLLVAWDDPVGLERAIAWARDPGSAPFGAVADRFTAEDTTFGQLANALGSGGHSPRAAGAWPSRVALGRALLAIFEDHDFERHFGGALYEDPRLRKGLVDEIAAAARRAIDRLEQLSSPSFNLGTQTAGLLGPLAKEDDQAAAALGERLFRADPRDERMLRDLNDAMAAGTGPATLSVLEQLSGARDKVVREEARAALERRRHR